LKWIRRFLDEDSDAASSEGGARDEYALRRESDHVNSPPPSVPADARAALLSKRSIRAVDAQRRLHVKSFADSDGEDILCICCGKDDGRGLVQCDDVVSLGVPRDQRHRGPWP
ncbi:hypothetical protein BGY98DRAFT_997298, partial [Russula aff. rugulosa BPL654]